MGGADNAQMAFPPQDNLFENVQCEHGVTYLTSNCKSIFRFFRPRASHRKPQVGVSDDRCL